MLLFSEYTGRGTWKVNRARGKSYDKYDLENDFFPVLRNNYESAVAITQAAIPLLEQSDDGEGRVAFISDAGVFFAPGFSSAYIASKRAVQGFADTLRVELALVGSRVSVSVLHVGEVETEKHIERTHAGGMEIGTVSHNHRYATWLEISPLEAAEQITCAIGRRVTDAYVPWYMHPVSALGSIVPLRPRIFLSNFVDGRSQYQTRIDKAAARSESHRMSGVSGA